MTDIVNMITRLLFLLNVCILFFSFKGSMPVSELSEQLNLTSIRDHPWHIQVNEVAVFFMNNNFKRRTNYQIDCSPLQILSSKRIMVITSKLMFKMSVHCSKNQILNDFHCR